MTVIAFIWRHRPLPAMRGFTPFDALIQIDGQHVPFDRCHDAVRVRGDRPVRRRKSDAGRAVSGNGRPRIAARNAHRDVSMLTPARGRPVAVGSTDDTGDAAPGVIYRQRSPV